MRDDLIGFVLGALDTDEEECLRRRIEQDEELQRKVQRVQCAVQPLAALKVDIEPPPGLAARTCECLGLGTRPETASTHPAGQMASPPPTPASRMPGWGVDRAAGYGEARHWTLPDFVVAAGVCLAAACLFFPALINSRYNMQLTGCQDNMRQLGQSFAMYSDSAGGYFPLIPASGKLSFAGAYAPILYTKGLLSDVRMLRCPSRANTVVLRFTVDDIDRAKGIQLVRIQKIAGGDYNYAFGYISGGRLEGIPSRGGRQGGAYTPILADSALENLRNAAITTHGRGENVLAADGHVAFIGTRIRPGSDGDDMYTNDLGQAHAGWHPEDSVLAASPVSPLPVGKSSLPRMGTAR